MSKIVVVVPTVRPESYKVFREQWDLHFKWHNVKLITIWDGDTPQIHVDDQPLGNAIDKVYSKHHDLFDYHKTDAVRNFGFYYAARHLDFDYVVTFDDDVLPLPNTDPIGDHLRVLGTKVPGSWMNTLMGVGVEYPRGVPYQVRAENTVQLSHGLWTGTLDWDGITQHYLTPQAVGDPDSYSKRQYYVGPVPSGVYFPFCFTPETEVSLADGSRKAIAAVKPGDRVITHNGRPRTVINTITRNFTGDLVDINVHGRDRSVKTTPDHKLLTQRGGIIQWCEAGELTVGDKLLTPVCAGDNCTPKHNIDVCRLLGYFIAEGSYRKYTNSTGAISKVALTFTFSKDEIGTLVEDCKSILQSLGVTSSLTLNKTSKACQLETNRDRELVAFVDKMCGEYSDGKHLPPECLYWPVEYKRQLLKGYWDGDGCFVENINRGSKWANAKTRSRTLAVQLQLLINSLGFVALVSKGKPRNKSKEYWSVNINGKSSEDFKKFLLTGTLPDIAASNAANCVIPGYIAYRIRKINRVPYASNVHTLTVEGDHSYLVEGLVAKNCGMNVACTREALPYMMYCPQGPTVGYHRWGDIWCGLNLTREFAKRNWSIYTGASVINHSRASNVYKNIDNENCNGGYEINENLYRTDDDQLPPFFAEYTRKRLKYQQVLGQYLNPSDHD